METPDDEQRMSYLNLNECNSNQSSAESQKSKSEVSLNESDKDSYEKEILKTIEEMKKEGKNYLNDLKIHMIWMKK